MTDISPEPSREQTIARLAAEAVLATLPEDLGPRLAAIEDALAGLAGLGERIRRLESAPAPAPAPPVIPEEVNAALAALAERVSALESAPAPAPPVIPEEVNAALHSLGRTAEITSRRLARLEDKN